MDTYFAPAMRTERRKLKNQIGNISHNPIMNSLLKATNGLLVVLNEDRQIVALNHTFLDALGIQNPEDVLGLRLGESLHCVHCAEKPNGCGTTPYCRTCGAAIAMMTAIDKNKADEQICALTAEHDGVTKDVSLLINAKPLIVDENRWILIYAQDITQQQHWENLERTFFHDINNVVSSIMGNSELLALDLPHSQKVQQIKKAAMRLESEVSLQSSLSQHREAQYLARKDETSITSIRQEVDQIVKGHPSSKNKEFIELWPSEDKTIFTDSLLVSRILGNMLINALEAASAGDMIKLTTKLETANVTWEVWNRGYIHSDIQKRIFQRHFSTKAELGRGLGTYSMKLFGEKYLGGEVNFVSTEEAGTIFRFRLTLVEI